jgi:TonB family protein
MNANGRELKTGAMGTNRLMRIFAVLLAMSALAQTPDPQLPPDVYRIGHGVTAPRVIEKTDPEYSEEARLAHLEGLILLRLIVDATGLVRDLKVTTPIGLGLDEKAIEAVSKWRFAPGVKDGQAVAVTVPVEVNFRLLSGKSDWHLERAVFKTPEGASRPTLAHSD